MAINDTENNNKDDGMDQLLDDIIEVFVPPIIEQLLNQNPDLDSKNISCILDELRKEDVLSNLLASIQMSIAIYDEFFEAAKDALEKKRYYAAIVLFGTYLEHLLNSFYTSFFTRKYGLNQANIDCVIRSLNIKDKCTWFLQVIADESMEDELLNDILRLNTLRNATVHYKYYGQTLDDLDDTPFNKSINEYLSTIEKLPEILLSLKIFCDQIVDRISPNRNMAIEIVDMIKEQKKGKSNINPNNSKNT